MRAQDNFRAPLLIQSGYLFHDAGPMQCNKYGSNCKTCAHFDRNEMYYLTLIRISQSGHTVMKQRGASDTVQYKWT